MSLNYHKISCLWCRREDEEDGMSVTFIYAFISTFLLLLLISSHHHPIDQYFFCLFASHLNGNNNINNNVVALLWKLKWRHFNPKWLSIHKMKLHQFLLHLVSGNAFNLWRTFIDTFIVTQIYIAHTHTTFMTLWPLLQPTHFYKTEIQQRD